MMPDMRFAPPNPIRIADRSGGLNAVSVRSHNERLILSLLLQKGGISRLEICERTNLSAQTVSVIMRSLEKEGLVLKGEAQKPSGRTGPPTIPMSLNPQGAFSVGVSVSYRQTEIALIDFTGDIQHYTSIPHTELVKNHQLIIEAINAAIRTLPKASQDRMTGIGLCVPEDVGAVDAPKNGGGNLLHTIQSEIEEAMEHPVFVQNDITAAAGGESMFGAAKAQSDYLFFYLGAALHSRLILNHQIYNGNSPISFDVGILSLERDVTKAGLSTEPLWERTSEWPDYGDILPHWEEKCIGQMTQSIMALSQFVEIKSIALSSYAPEKVCQDICQNLQERLPHVTALAGNIATSPKAVGAASLPFSSRFMVQ